jgi:predicted TIM-barrel fold metal-dependent hydrolase
MRFRIFIVPLLATLFLGACAETNRAPVPPADHHVHIPTTTTADALSERVGAPINAMSADDAVALLDSAQIEQATVLSLAYFFGMPEVDVENEYAKVRAENDSVAQRAAQHPDRLVAFCSVNPLTDYALDEIGRCAAAPHLDGLKLHLANSDVDLRDSTDVQRLAAVFAVANRLQLPIVIHLWTRHPDYGRPDAETFIREVLTEAPDVPVQVAHLGGAGLFDDATEGALEAFHEAIQNGAAILDDDVFFDLGAVTMDPEAALARGDTARAQRFRQASQRVARWIERIGVERVVFGSDYFAREPATYVETIRSLPLDESTLRDLFDNAAPYLR